MSVEIPLTQGQFAIVDDEDAELVLAQGRWFAKRDGRTFYAGRKTRRVGGGQATLHLHTLLTGWPLVDHVNGDGLDNRRANLRPATKVENSRNRRLQSNNRSGFRGVSWITAKRRWRASICVQGRRIYLGHYTTPEAAAAAYDAAAREHFGEFARLNFPSPTGSVAHHTPRV